MTGPRIVPVQGRRHTVYFQEFAARQRAVFLDTEVDMARVEAHREAARDASGRTFSRVSYVLFAVGRVLAEYPAANAVMAPGWPSRWRAPRVARYDGVTAKLALDRELQGERSVLSALVPGVERAGLAEIQQRVDRYRGPGTDQLPEFAGVRKLVRLPVPLGRLAFGLAMRDLARREQVFGTVSVSSLGHGQVDGFHSVGGTALTVNLGRVVDRPVVRDGAVAVVPVMRLNLAFDHRVVDGALASDVLGALKQQLEEFDDRSGAEPVGAAVRTADQDRRPGRALAPDRR
ncbi:2-oxo acid dehydrogenase subunit E2 [Streptacidiphilus albus]|uniref:2-oxo acid dehydrogenase subunit E2 n=1 Tax=Streptacidiphilus albus TaxID=105425 RepID=UPI00054B5B25|nr:2-oxo acid dehydrogenase subunit E2 [Streptacidiphilus albus]